MTINITILTGLLTNLSIIYPELAALNNLAIYQRKKCICAIGRSLVQISAPGWAELSCMPSPGDSWD